MHGSLALRREGISCFDVSFLLASPNCGMTRASLRLRLPSLSRAAVAHPGIHVVSFAPITSSRISSRQGIDEDRARDCDLFAIESLAASPSIDRLATPDSDPVT